MPNIKKQIVSRIAEAFKATVDEMSEAGGGVFKDKLNAQIAKFSTFTPSEHKMDVSKLHPGLAKNLWGFAYEKKIFKKNIFRLKTDFNQEIKDELHKRIEDELFGDKELCKSSIIIGSLIFIVACIIFSGLDLLMVGGLIIFAVALIVIPNIIHGHMTYKALVGHLTEEQLTTISQETIPSWRGQIQIEPVAIELQKAGL